MLENKDDLTDEVLRLKQFLIESFMPLALLLLDEVHLQVAYPLVLSLNKVFCQWCVRDRSIRISTLDEHLVGAIL